MSSKLQPVRGTHDLLPEASRRFRHIVETAREISERYGYGEIMTPIFEFSDVFHRTLGDTSDVVTKETYTFNDRGGESLTLRPEFTAGIARAFISGGLMNELPLKWFYAGPAFRYERPQKGRLRQFHQMGAELLGVAEPQGDVESIALAYGVLSALGLKDKVKLEINTLGDPETRAQYREYLVRHFTQYSNELSEDSRIRLEKNPLRILDSKDEGDKAVIARLELKHVEHHLTDNAARFYAAVRDGLGRLGIPFNDNPHIVRGLDYYNHTVFEFTTEMLGAQGTVLAGGRYDGLIALMGGPATPGIGWAAGIERLMMLMGDLPSLPSPIAIVPLGDAAEAEALLLAQTLRTAGFCIELGYKGNLAKRIKKADKLGAKAALILGESERAKGVVMLKDLATGEQREVALATLVPARAPYARRD